MSLSTRSSTLALGIDPDTKGTGWALLEQRGTTVKILKLGIVRAKGRLASDRAAGMAYELRREMLMLHLGLAGELDICAIEFMHLRPTHKEKNPNDLMPVQAVAGMCVSATLDFQPKHLFMPTPPEWKKSMEKSNKQAWILRKAGLDEELRYIQSDGSQGEFAPGADKVLKSMRTHVIDAIGIATWALDPYGPLFQAELNAKARARTRQRRAQG